MTTIQHPLAAYIGRHSTLAAVIYLALLALLIATTSLMVVGLSESYGERNASLDRLTRLEGHETHSNSDLPSGVEAWPPGSPVLEGSTVTIAGAALLQRVSSAITRANGSLDSSELEGPQPEAKDKLLRATATFEIAQPALQNVLFDIEGGMPFLFIEQLFVNPVSEDGRKVRVVARVSGRWSGTN
jgi:general secretion pathway protein M